jgi:hypothetical protein
VIADSHLVPVAGRAPRGRYALQVGLYDPSTGVRLAASGPPDQAGDSYAVLGPVIVP